MPLRRKPGRLAPGMIGMVEYPASAYRLLLSVKIDIVFAPAMSRCSIAVMT